MFRVYTQLNRKYNSILTFDPTYLDISEDHLMKFDWKCLSGDFKESIPPNEPEIKDKWIDLIIHVDSGYVGENIKRCSRAGFCYFRKYRPYPVVLQSSANY